MPVRKRSKRLCLCGNGCCSAQAAVAVQSQPRHCKSCACAQAELRLHCNSRFRTGRAACSAHLPRACEQAPFAANRLPAAGENVRRVPRAAGRGCAEPFDGQPTAGEEHGARRAAGRQAREAARRSRCAAAAEPAESPAVQAARARSLDLRVGSLRMCTGGRSRRRNRRLQKQSSARKKLLP